MNNRARHTLEENVRKIVLKVVANEIENVDYN